MSIDERLRAGLALPDAETLDLDELLVSTLRRVDHRWRVRRAGYAVGLVAAAAAAIAIVIGVDHSPKSLDPIDPVEDQVRVLDSSQGSAEEPAPLAPGRYAIPFIGAADDAPWAEIDVPAGWGHDRLHPATGPDLDPHLRRIELLTVGTVLPDPCQGARESAGAGVADLMRALTAQETVEPGIPRPVTIDGYSGQLLRVRVPLDVDLATCANTNALVPLEVQAGASAYSVFPGWTYRIWAIDVEGHRLVIAAAHGPDTTTTELTELTNMVESLTFVEPVTT